MHKRLIALFVMLATVVVLVVLFSAVFVVREITVLLPEGTGITEQEITEALGIKKGASIFNVSKENSKGLFEKQYPLLGIEKIEKQSPDKIEVTIFVREAVAVMSVPNDARVLILDKDLKILEVRDNLAAAAGLKKISNLSPESVVFENAVGEFLDLSHFRYKKLRDILNAYNEENIADGAKYLAQVKEIDFVSDENALIILSDVKIQIKGSKNIDLQVNEATAFYLQLKNYQPGGTIFNDGAGWKYQD